MYAEAAISGVLPRNERIMIAARMQSPTGVWDARNGLVAITFR